LPEGHDGPVCRMLGRSGRGGQKPGRGSPLVCEGVKPDGERVQGIDDGTHTTIVAGSPRPVQSDRKARKGEVGKPVRRSGCSAVCHPAGVEYVVLSSRVVVTERFLGRGCWAVTVDCQL
jgi:hypothetical protein